ncbi:MAG: hypothetical protein K6B44_07380 [Lachnospiraceae bacterium]|nr:hypothetical protein [Lachnospiraceae bacterium]
MPTQKRKDGRKMLKKKVLKLMCGVLTLTVMLGGCGKETEDRTAETSSHVREEKKETPEEDKQEPEEVIPEDEPLPEDEGRTEPTMTEWEYAFSNGSVDNNGTYFVRVGDKVYFRNIPASALDEGAIFGEFLSTENEAVQCPLIEYDLNTQQWEEAGQISGTGKLFACPKGFYIGYPDLNDYADYGVQLYDIESGTQTEYCKGIPKGVSESGEILAVDRYTGQISETVLIKDGTEIACLGGENLYYEYCGFAGETLIALLHSADEEYILCSVDENGIYTELGKVSDNEMGYPTVEQFLSTGNEVYLSIAYYEGTGHFLYKWEAVKAYTMLKDSLEQLMTGDDIEDGGEGYVPRIYIDETGTLCDAPHLPYEVFMGEGSEENNLYYLTDIFDNELMVEDFIDNDYGDSCQVIQDITATYDTAFIIYADAEMNSDYDIGWRTGYKLTGWHICALPGFDHVSGGSKQDIIMLGE